jgi:SagB-type dehydrogenase family enzyme
VASASAPAVPVVPPSESAGALESLLLHRRTSYDFDRSRPLSSREIGRLAWAAQGITHEGGKRTAPSAGGLHPLELYVVALRVSDLEPGVYRYDPHGSRLVAHRPGDRAEALVAAALGQEPVRHAAAVFVLAGVWERTTAKYGARGRDYVLIEAGHASQNLMLAAVSLELKVVPVGGFYQDKMDAWLGVDGARESVLYLNCVAY